MDTKAVRAYFRRRLWGKSALALAVDTLLLCAGVYIACCWWFWQRLGNSLLARALAAITTCFFAAALGLYRGARLDAYIKKQRALLESEALCAKLLLMEEGDLLTLAARSLSLERASRCMGFIVSGNTLYTVLRRHPGHKLSPSELLPVFDAARRCGCRRAELFTLSEYSSQAVAFAATLPIEFTLHGKEKLAGFALDAGVISDADAEEYIRSVINSGRRKRKFTPLAPGNARRYAYSALIVAAAAFPADSGAYYAAVSGACLLLGGICYLRGKRAGGRLEA